MGLGRGLSALLGEIEQEAPVGAKSGGASPAGVRMVDIADMRPMANQPRQHFDETALAELAQSIEARGLLQPIVVRDLGGKYEIVAGERRWRAAQQAQLHQIPVIIKELDESAVLEIAIVENVQREQLNAIEEAHAYRRLAEDYGHSQEDIGRLVGKSRSHIANLIRLSTLPDRVKGMLARGDLSMGHARALLTCEDPETLAKQVVARDLSVRETEKLARAMKKAAAGQTAPRPVREKDPDVAALERQLGDLLGIKVEIRHGATGGSVTLGYSTLDQLDMICQRLSGERI